MYSDDIQFRDLCRAVARGEDAAVVRFRRAVVPHLQTVVRRALRPGHGASPLNRRLRLAARKFEAKKDRLSTRLDESCISHLALALCDLLIRTVRAAPGSSPDETILRVLEPETIRDESALGRSVGW